MAGVERVDFGIRQIALERLRTGTMNEGSFRPQTTKIGGLCSATMLAARSANTANGMDRLLPRGDTLRHHENCSFWAWARRTVSR